MVYSCCVPGCKTGYKSRKTTTKIAVFQFPKDESLRKQWIKAIPRKNWKLSDSHRVCEKHFHDHHFQRVSTEQLLKRRNKRDSQQLRYIRLKPTAVPQVFPELPKHLSTAA